MNKNSSWKKRFPNFKKNFVRIMALTLAGLMLIATLIMSLMPTYAEGIQTNQYALNIHVSESFRGAQVEQTVRYTNHTGYTLDAVLFSLAANMYRRTATVPVEYEQLNDAYPAGFAPGGVELYSVEVNGETADWGVSGEGEEFLRIACNLKSEESAEFVLRFDLALPSTRNLMGINADELRLFGFYPQVEVFDDALEEFVLISPTPLRDMTYADISDYQVTIQAPERYLLAAPGEVTVENIGNGYKKWSVNAQGVRDFAAILHYKRHESVGKTTSGTQVHVMANNWLGANRTLSTAIKALEVYEGWFGTYPYSDLVIADADILSASSHSGFIALPNGLFSFANRAALEHAIAYQVARQWFGLLIASNPQLEPWLDDSMCSYAALMYYEAAYNTDSFKKELNAQVLDALQLTLPGIWVDSATNYFVSKQEYALVVHDRGAAVMHEIRDVMGDEAFFEGFRLYAGRIANGHASIADFSRAMSDAAGKDMDYFIMEMLRNIGDYANQQMERYGY